MLDVPKPNFDLSIEGFERSSGRWSKLRMAEMPMQVDPIPSSCSGESDAAEKGEETVAKEAEKRFV